MLARLFTVCLLAISTLLLGHAVLFRRGIRLIAADLGLANNPEAAVVFVQLVGLLTSLLFILALAWTVLEIVNRRIEEHAKRVAVAIGDIRRDDAVEHGEAIDVIRNEHEQREGISLFIEKCAAIVGLLAAAAFATALFLALS